MKKIYMILGTVLLLFLGVGTFFDLTIAQQVFMKDNGFSYFFEHFAPLVYASIFLLSAACLLFTHSLKEMTKVTLAFSCFFYALFSMLGLLLCMAYAKIVGLAYGIVVMVVVAFVVKKLPKNIKPALFYTGVTMLAVAFCSMVLVESIKPIVGRVRFRSMQEDVGLYTRWYQINGEKYLSLVPAKEEIKSFPSGHSQWAGTTLVLSLFALVQPKWRALESKLFFVALGYAFIVMLSRMMQGAHFLSDVTVGFSSAFVFYLAFRYILKKKLATLD